MSSPAEMRAEALRQEAMARVRSEHYDEALALYDEALTITRDEEARELITINKADALIALERSGAEVQQLPAILMRRRNLHHTFLAAYALMYKHRLQNEPKRGIFYGQVALDAAVEANNTLWKLGALNELAIIYETDSQFAKAIECLEEALTLVDGLNDQFSHAALVQNLGYNKLLVGETAEGIRLLLSILDKVQGAGTLADAHLDLCYGYLDLEEYEKARYFGEIALELASETRQIRNAHYLLGEVAMKSGDIETADHHFEELARFYPQFRNLKSLLFAIDLRGMVNFRL